MAKWADYVITGVWKNGEHITYVMLHEDGENSIVSPGKKTSRETAVGLLKKGYTMVTAEWNYKTAKWDRGADVDFETKNNVDYLRSYRNKVINDNLDNLLKMGNFFA